MGAIYQGVVEAMARFRDKRKGSMRFVVWWIVAACGVLAGLITSASKHQSHSRRFSSRKGQVQAPLASTVFSSVSNQILRGGQGRLPNTLERDGIVGTVTRSEPPTLTSRADVSVPQTIWRTARSRRDTPAFATDLFNSWTRLNPGWDQYFLDDEDIVAFVGAHYNDTVLQAFKELPLGVMKADLFRYMIMHKYGGVYADMDTECKQPIEHWAPRGCHFAVSIEHHLYFCQWAFASVPGHGILGSIIDNALRHVISREYQDKIGQGEEFVMDITGPVVFTAGILEFLGVQHYKGENQHLARLVYDRRKEFRERGVCILTALEMASMLQNHFGHRHEDLQGGSWGSWTLAQVDVLKKAKKARKKDSKGRKEGANAEGSDADGPDADEPDADEPDADEPDADEPDADVPDEKASDTEDPDVEELDAEGAGTEARDDDAVVDAAGVGAEVQDDDAVAGAEGAGTEARDDDAVADAEGAGAQRADVADDDEGVDTEGADVQGADTDGAAVRREQAGAEGADQNQAEEKEGQSADTHEQAAEVSVGEGLTGG